MRRAAAAVIGLAALAAGILWIPARGPVRLEVGGFEDGLLEGAWSRVERQNLDPPAATDDVLSFYMRSSPPTSGVALPIVPRGANVRLTLRGVTSVRGDVAVFVGGQAAGKILLTRGPWAAHTITFPAALAGGGPLDVSLALRPLPLVRGGHIDNPQLFVDFVEVEADEGWRLSPSRILMLAAGVAAITAFAFVIGLPMPVAMGSGLGAAVLVVVLARVAPLGLVVAVPRLLPLALAAGLAAYAALVMVAAHERAALAALVAAGTLAHGSVVFFPNHFPPDIDIHVRRSVDLGTVPFVYGDMMVYGSQVPTVSQDRGSATEALGARVLIPYSPLPNIFYYAAHRAGLSLFWAMTALNAALAMLVVVPLWLAARRVWSDEAAWIATGLYVLDLAVWHHLGRSHAPAVFGGALGTMALLYLLARADEITDRRRVILAGIVLGVAVLGYSSLVVLFGFFGLVLLVLLMIEARGLPKGAGRGLALALVVGGLLAGALFYFHYVPGLLRGATGIEAEEDQFPGRTYWIFHNESKHSLRLWALGFAIPLTAGLLAAPLAVWRATRAARPILVAWLAAWAFVMFFKEPFLFPKLLRWAKEDQFLSPLLCLFIGAAVAAVPHRVARWGLAALVLAVALAIEWRDFLHHASSLLL